MSYALGQTASGVQVGPRAARDPILARGSLAAAKILAASARKPKGARPAFIRRAVRQRFNAKTQAEFVARLGKANTDQAVYDALRLSIADYYMGVGLRYIQGALKKRYGSKFIPAPLQGLGALGEEPDEGRAIGCAVGGVTTGLLATIVGAYTGGAGAAPIGAVGTMAMGAAGCSAGAQAAQGELAASQAQLAQAQLQAAQIAAEAADRRAAEQQKMIITIAAIGGGAILLLGAAYMIVK